MTEQMNERKKKMSADGQRQERAQREKRKSEKTKSERARQNRIRTDTVKEARICMDKKTTARRGPKSVYTNAAPFRFFRSICSRQERPPQATGL